MKKYKVGDSFVNGAGIKTIIQKHCLTCKTFTGKEGHKSAKCCVKSSCPGWKKYSIPHERIRRQHDSIRNGLK